MKVEARSTLSDTAVEAVRQASRELRLVTQGDILTAVMAAAPDIQPCCPKKNGTDMESPSPYAKAGQQGQELHAKTEQEALLCGILAGHPSLASFKGLCGQTLYHAPDLLSHTYARILDRKGSPLTLMVEEIRTNSKDYPRPVPVELFEAPPFDLTPEEIKHALQAMNASSDYQDITFTTAATGTVYLFSTRHLERGYAAFLAQRAESLVLNP